jgi:mevalonate kinase
MKVVASAPGKVNLVGELANLFERPTILAAIDLRTTVEITPSQETLVSSSLADAASTQVVRLAVEDAVIRALNPPTIHAYTARIESSLPMRGRLGSSAALATAYCAALAQHLGVAVAAKELNQMAYEVEQTLHGRSSGSDNTISVHGGVLWFRRTQSGALTHEKLFINGHVSKWKFCIVDSGAASETAGEMIAQLQSTMARDPDPVRKAIDSLEQLAHTIRAALGQGDWDSYATATTDVHKCLIQLRAVGERAQAIVDALAGTGCVAKVMGCGGYATGSGMLLVAAPDEATLIEAAERTGLVLMPVMLGEPGFHVETR